MVPGRLAFPIGTRRDRVKQPSVRVPAVDPISRSPAMDAQRQRIGRSFGGAVQLEEAAARGCCRFLADTGQPLAEGQWSKDEFLSRMSLQVLAASKEILGPFGMAQDDCPDLKYWVAHYKSLDAAHVEQVIARYAPATEGAADAQQYLALLLDRIRAGLLEHTRSGASVDPEPPPPSLDRQRPPLSVFALQRVAMPVAQLGCGSVEGVAEVPDAAIVTEAAAVAQIRTRAAHLRRLFLQGDNEAIADLLFATVSPAIRREEYNDDATAYMNRELWSCAATATALSKAVLGSDRTPQHGATSMWPLERGPAGGPPWVLHRAFNATLNANGDCYYQMSMNGISHHFIIVRLEGRYDFFESDDNPPAGGKLNLLLPGHGGRDLSRAYMTPQTLAGQLAAMYERCGIDPGKGDITTTVSYRKQPLH